MIFKIILLNIKPHNKKNLKEFLYIIIENKLDVNNYFDIMSYILINLNFHICDYFLKCFFIINSF